MHVIKRFSGKTEELTNTIRVTWAEIDAEDAIEMLEYNTDNRKLRKAKVDEYKRAIERGDFLFNGDAIVISADKVLLDGQHRLAALAETNNSISTLIVEGVPSFVRATIDVGATRTAANLLEFGDESERIHNAVNIAALGRAALIMEDQPMPSKLEVVQFVKANEEELEIAYRNGVRAIEGSALKGGTTPYALAAWLIAKAEPNRAIVEYFFHKLATGEGLFMGDPILTLRNRLLSRPPRTEGGSRHRYQHNSVLFIRAWNAFASGAEMTQLRAWGEGQSFPEVKQATDEVLVRVTEEMSELTALAS